jgi:hypothetical protein
MSELADAAVSLVTPDELIRLASDLVAIPSFKGEETPVGMFIADWCERRGYAVEIDEVEPGRKQVIATLKGSGGGRSLMLNGHTDINSLTRGWDRNPWSAWVDGDKLYGHGVQNMKGGLATIMVAADAVRRSGAPLAGRSCPGFRRWRDPGRGGYASPDGAWFPDGHGDRCGAVRRQQHRDHSQRHRAFRHQRVRPIGASQPAGRHGPRRKTRWPRCCGGSIV